LLAWILVTKLAPTYYRKLDQLLTKTGRYRELSCWRKGFKKEWRKLEKRPITLPFNDTYRPNTEKWICTCPSFVVSCFLICKHIIQLMHRVPLIFFLEAKRYRTAPFWRHKSLRPLEEEGAETMVIIVESVIDEHVRGDEDENDEAEDDDEDEDEGCVETHQEDGRTFEEAMEGDIDLILDFARGLVFAGSVLWTEKIHRTELNRTAVRSFFRLWLPKFCVIPVAGCLI
jgi:hypothetical protein